MGTASHHADIVLTVYDELRDVHETPTAVVRTRWNPAVKKRWLTVHPHLNIPSSIRRCDYEAMREIHFAGRRGILILTCGAQ